MTPEVKIRKMKVATWGTRPGAFLPWHLGKSPLTRRKEVSRAQRGSWLGPGNLTPQTSWVGHSPLSPATPPASSAYSSLARCDASSPSDTWLLVSLKGSYKL